jgi:hypothetical protein
MSNRCNKIFFIFNGRNGATYILNTKNWDTLTFSLKFYRANTLKSKLFKLGLKTLLFLNGKFSRFQLRTAPEVENFVQSIVKNRSVFNIENNCSILISPTQDKVIVNHHGKYFHKFAFEESFYNVKKEANVYRLFHKNIENFQVSCFYPENVDVLNNYCSFKLSNEKLTSTTCSKTGLELIPALAEFFLTVKGENIKVDAYLDKILHDLEIEGLELGNSIQVIHTLKSEFGDFEFPIGLVHKDFKPWNIVPYEKPLIFDFEETVVDGPPLEDFLNYIVDPLLHKEDRVISEAILKRDNIKSYSQYLDELNIHIHYKVFLLYYLINRILFWHKKGKIETSKKYQRILLSIYSSIF